MKKLRILLAFFIQTSIFIKHSSLAQTPSSRPIELSDEQTLYNFLFDPQRGYDVKIAPPGKDKEGKLHFNIELELELIGIMEVDKDASTVKFKANLRQWWNDTRLAWNTSDYGGVEMIYLDSGDNKQSWLPDTVIREDAGSKYFSDFKDMQVRVYNTGLCFWSRLGELTVVTSLDFTKYPFDSQYVNITVGSWVHNDKRITYHLRNGNEGLIIQDQTNWHLDNLEWNFEKSLVLPITVTNSRGTFNFSRFHIIIKRDGGTMLFGLIIPGVLVAFLGSVYYLLEMGTGVRISYLATILLTEIMFLVMITQIVPQSKFVPAIAFMFLKQTILLSAVTIIVLILDNRKQNFDRRLEQFGGNPQQTNEEGKQLFSKIQVNYYTIQEEEGGTSLMKLDTNAIDKRAELVGQILRLKKLDLIFFIFNISVFFYITTEMILAVQTYEN